MVADGEKKKIPDTPLPSVNHDYIYPKDSPPVFFGHYWMTGVPEIVAENMACLDYSAGMGGSLIAYHWKKDVSAGERLDTRNFTYIGTQTSRYYEEIINE